MKEICDQKNRWACYRLNRDLLFLTGNFFVKAGARFLLVTEEKTEREVWLEKQGLLKTVRPSKSAILYVCIACLTYDWGKFNQKTDGGVPIKIRAKSIVTTKNRSSCPSDFKNILSIEIWKNQSCPRVSHNRDSVEHGYFTIPSKQKNSNWAKCVASTKCRSSCPSDLKIHRHF